MSLSTSARASFPLVLVIAAACSAREPAGAAPPPSTPAVAVPRSTAAPEAKPADDPDASLKALVCNRRELCALVKEHPAGKDANGRALSAALFFVGVNDLRAEAEDASQGGAADPEAGEGDPPAPDTVPPSDPNLTLESNGATFGVGSYDSCFEYEYWRIVRDGSHIVEADRVAEICNDGHGAAGLGEDSVTVGPNSIEVSTSGGSAWRWAEATRYSLSPFVRKLQMWSGYWSMAHNHERGQIDWESLTGDTTWYSPPCDESGAVPEPPEDGPPASSEHAHLWIPSLPLDPAFLANGWKTTRLDRCAASIDAAGVTGYLLSGKEGTAADSQLRILAAEGGALFVEVVDDTVVAEDRLEVWVGPPVPTFSEHCIDPTTTGVFSWNVRVTDARVTAGFGKPAPTSLTAERADDPSGAVRFRLVPPPLQKALTIAYADSDGGKKIERRIATSRLVDGRLATMGSLSPAGEHLSCTVKDGALVPQIRPEKVNNP